MIIDFRGSKLEIGGPIIKKLINLSLFKTINYSILEV
jgi:hypothetical protein